MMTLDSLLAVGMPAEASIPERLRKRVSFWAEVVRQTSSTPEHVKAAREKLRVVVQEVIRHKGGR